MKIANTEVTNAQALGAAAAVVVIAAGYLFGYGPLMKELSAKHAEYRALTSRLIQERAMIRLAGKTAGERVLMTEKEASLAMNELTRHGKSRGINFRSIKPRDLVEPAGAQYKIFPVEAEIEGTPEQVTAFIGSLDALQKNLVTVESFEVTRSSLDPALLRLIIVVNIYFSTT